MFRLATLLAAILLLGLVVFLCMRFKWLRSRPPTAIRLFATSLIVGAAMPAVLGIVARQWLAYQGREVMSWSEGAVAVLLVTVFLFLPLYVVFAFIVLALLGGRREERGTRGRVHLATGALIGLTLAVGSLLFALFLQGQSSLLVLLVPFFWGTAALGGIAGALVGWLIRRLRG